MPRLSPVALMLVLCALCPPAAAADGEGQPVARETPAAGACAPELSAALSAGDAKLTRADREERTALFAFYAARACAPLWVAASALSPRGAAVVAEIADAGAWGLDASAFRLPPTAEREYARTEAAAAEALISLAVLKYARHARGGRAEPTSLSYNLDRPLPLRDPMRVLGEIAEASDVGAYLRQLNPRHPQFEALRQKYLAERGAQASTGHQPSTEKLLVNMEEWRWMPEDLGAFHVAVNVPEFMLRVVKDGKVIHTQRVIVGKADKQTPIFSADLDKVIFHPSWGVPNSIKVNDILPSLLRGSTRILERYNLRVQRGGRDIDPAGVDWVTTDMRSIHIYQPPGGANVLGFVKFRFPNKHDVYMHDTPDKYLFRASARAFSHGCMRLSEPEKLAELLLAEDQAWPSARVAAAIARGPLNDQIAVQGKFPVHVTYFTAVVDETGKLVTFPDIYGHEMRIALGMAGKAHLIPKTPATAARSAEVIGRLTESSSARREDWVRRAFGNN